MATEYPSPDKVDPVTFLDCVLKSTWHAVCDSFDVIAEIPSIDLLFSEADVCVPQQAAESVLVNMIIEAIEHIGRFSPWYTQPACQFGLYSIHDEKTKSNRWILTPNALYHWQEPLKKIQLAIEKNSGLIQASLLIDQITIKELSEGKQIAAQCKCCPPRLIRVKIEILEKSTVTCDACHCDFIPV